MLVKQMIVIVPLALAVALSACSSPTLIPTPVPPNTTPTPKPTTTPQITATPPSTPTPIFTPTPNPKDLLLGALSSALSKIKTYRVKVPEENRLMEVVLPDRVRQVEDEPVVRIGPLYYQPNIDAQPRNVPSVPFMDRVNLVWFQDEVSKSSGPNFLGPTTIDGTPSIGYSTNFTILRISPSTSPDATPVVTQLPQQVKVWFATTDGFPRRIEYGAPISVTINFYDYNAKIEINPP